MKSKTIATGVALMAGSLALAAALTESDLRTALAKWMIGDHVIQNPWEAVLDYFDDSRIVATGGWDPGSIVTNQSATVSITATGAEVGDPVVASFDSYAGQADFLLSAQATNDLVKVTLFNNSGAAVDFATGTVKVIVFKY